MRRTFNMKVEDFIEKFKIRSDNSTPPPDELAALQEMGCILSEPTEDDLKHIIYSEMFDELFIKDLRPIKAAVFKGQITPDATPKKDLKYYYSELCEYLDCEQEDILSIKFKKDKDNEMTVVTYYSF